MEKIFIFYGLNFFKTNIILLGKVDKIYVILLWKMNTIYAKFLGRLDFANACLMETEVSAKLKSIL